MRAADAKGGGLPAEAEAAKEAKMRMSLETAKALVRPIVTVGLVTTQAALAVAWHLGADSAPESFAALSPFTMMAMTFWFRDRDDAAS